MILKLFVVIKKYVAQQSSKTPLIEENISKCLIHFFNPINPMNTKMHGQKTNKICPVGRVREMRNAIRLIKIVVL